MKRFSICFNVFLLLFLGCNGLKSGSGTCKVRMAIFVEQERGQGVPVVEMNVFSADPKVFYVTKDPVLEMGQGTLEGAYLIDGQDWTMPHGGMQHYGTEFIGAGYNNTNINPLFITVILFGKQVINLCIIESHTSFFLLFIWLAHAANHN